jgi:hypothetical protein
MTSDVLPASENLALGILRIIRRRSSPTPPAKTLRRQKSSVTHSVLFHNVYENRNPKAEKGCAIQYCVAMCPLRAGLLNPNVRRCLEALAGTPSIPQLLVNVSHIRQRLALVRGKEAR